MKKFLALTLACLMALTFVVSVYAADGEVYVEVNVDEPEVFKYTVSWETFNFTYDLTKTWSDTQLEYSESGTWTKNAATVTVTNNSNVDVTVAFSYADNDETYVDGIEVGLVKDSALVDALDDVTLGNKADGDSNLSTTATVKAEGDPTSASSGTTLVGTVNVSVVAA